MAGQSRNSLWMTPGKAEVECDALVQRTSTDESLALLPGDLQGNGAKCGTMRGTLVNCKLLHQCILIKGFASRCAWQSTVRHRS